MWHQIAVTVDEGRANSLSDFFTGLGAISVGLEDAGEEPLFEPKPGEIPLWRRTRVVALFEDNIDGEAVRTALTAKFGNAFSDWGQTELQDQVWERAWLEHFRPMRFGRRLWICPSGFEPPEPGAVTVWLDPGLAFGTGTHPTTALCLEWLEGRELAGKTLIDYGCGSGILALAALKLGTAKVHAVDIDPQALTASADNARKNGVETGLELGYPGDLPDIRADAVVANILAGPLAELAGDLVRRLKIGGGLALSGILAGQVEEVRRAYAPWIEFGPAVLREEWALLAGKRTH